MTKVYAVVYLASSKANPGPFLMARKLDKGYFFSDKGGVLVSGGQRLNNAGGYALPGGGREVEDKDVSAAAAREFAEETGALLPPKMIQEAFTLLPKSQKGFAAAYFSVKSREDFKGAISGINEQNLPQARQAAQDVHNGKIKDYAAIEEMHAKGCPLSDELAAVYNWDVTNTDNWREITSWKGSESHGWFYEILLNLKTTILPLKEDYIS